MIQLYSWPTPNGHKVHILLEELGLPYQVHGIDIRAGDQFSEEFLRISPNNKIPAIVDEEGPDGQPLTLFESGAILIYLAEKHRQLLPEDPRRRAQTLQWLMFQMGGVGPFLGQAHHFIKYAPETIEYAVRRYTNEANRLYAVMDKRLGEAEYLAGDYSIADIATYPWTRSYDQQNVDIAEYPNVRRWQQALEARSAVQRGLEVLKDAADKAKTDDNTAWEAMFGSKQYQRR